MVEIFLLQKWIDLDELNPMVWVPSIVRRRIDFSLAVFELGALRASHQYKFRTIPCVGGMNVAKGSALS